MGICGDEVGDESRKIGIAFVLWTLEGMAGSERVVYDIVRKLDRRRYSVVIIGFADGPVRKMYEDAGARAYVVSKKKRIDLKFICDLRRILLRENIEVVNPHHYYPLKYSFLATRFSGIKLAYTEHSRWQLEQLTPLNSIANRLFLRRSDAVVAISRQIEDYYRNGMRLKKDKIHLITNGVDLAVYEGANGDHLRHQLGIEKQERVVGMVGNIRPEKNHKLLISAFWTIAKELKNVRLILVGLDLMNGEIQSFATKIGAGKSILFLGQRDDVPDLLKIFDVYCLPSLYEGMPLTVLEAMASGVPVIGSDTLGINEVINDNVNGILFPVNDEQRLAELIKKLLVDQNLRNRLRESAKAFVKQNYSLDDKVKQYDNLFQTLCRN
jgi:glycosyltransferase involved in cell wall biosynthesis